MGARSAESGGAGHGKGRVMNRRKFLLGSAAALTGSGLLVGTQGSSRVESQREVAVDVVGDEDAYLGITYPESVEFGCEKTVEIGLRNQTKVRLDQIDVDAHVRGDGVTVDDVDEPDSIELGDKEVVEVTLSCDGGTGSEPTLAFDVSVAGEDTSIETERSRVIELECECTREKSAWAYGGKQEMGQACDKGDNPFWTADNPGAIANMESCTHQWRWGWYVTKKQLDSISGSPTLYAGADGNDLDSGLEVGDLYVEIRSDSEGNEELFVNYLVKDSVRDKSIELKSTKFTVVEDAADILNNGGDGVAPGGWKHSDPGDGKGETVPLDGMNEFVLAAHATVTVTETDS
jgi:hypothetical protein